MNEYAQAIFDEAGHNLNQAIKLLDARTCDHLLFGAARFRETVAVHSQALRDIINLDADHALGMTIDPPSVRRRPLQGREDLRELVRSMK